MSFTLGLLLSEFLGRSPSLYSWWLCHSFLLALLLFHPCMHVCYVLQLCPTLRDPVDCSLIGSSVHGILQARRLEWVAMPSSRGSSQPKDRNCVSWISCTAGGFFTTEPPAKPSLPTALEIKRGLRFATMAMDFLKPCQGKQYKVLMQLSGWKAFGHRMKVILS